MLSIPMRISAILVAASIMNTAWAATPAGPVPTHVSAGHPPSAGVAIETAHGAVMAPAATPVAYGRYPHLNAPLYPSPVQYTPPWNGGTIITNQALAPHEALYPHTYHAMYPPFYYKVKGSWIWTPFGMRQHEHWKLQGTEVKVKYRAHYPLFGGFIPPRVD